jgi:hypothetical protein
MFLSILTMRDRTSHPIITASLASKDDSSPYSPGLAPCHFGDSVIDSNVSKDGDVALQTAVSEIVTSIEPDMFVSVF